MFDKIYPYRFPIFLITLLAVLFGSLVFPESLFDNIIAPVILLFNLTAGILLISRKKKLMIFFIILFIIVAFDLGSIILNVGDRVALKFIRIGVYYLFYGFVTFEVITQIWNSKTVDTNVIFGVISGYLSLGLIAFFICLSIEMVYPGSFQGLLTSELNPGLESESIMYYSFITMLTIGYGDILPVTEISQKASFLIGLMGQFYMVIITAIIVGKYIQQTSSK